MLVKERMSHPVVTIRPKLPIMEALHLMKVEHIRRLPVVDKRGRLVGIVTEQDLLHAAPSSATSLSVWESELLDRQSHYKGSYVQRCNYHHRRHAT